MSSSLREQIFKLSAAVRLRLIEHTFAEDEEAPPLSEDQSQDLARRLAEADADPEGGSAWDETRERIRRQKR